MSNLSTLRHMRIAVNGITEAQERASAVYFENIQRLVNHYGVELATGHLSDTWQVLQPDGSWLAEWEAPKRHRFFQALRRLDAIAEDFGIGPSNMESFKPEKSR